MAAYGESGRDHCWREDCVYGVSISRGWPISTIMVDRSSHSITIRISEDLVNRLNKQSKLRRRSQSALVRDALEVYLEKSSSSSSAYDLAKGAGLIGCVRAAPSDLSRNRK